MSCFAAPRAQCESLHALFFFVAMNQGQQGRGYGIRHEIADQLVGQTTIIPSPRRFGVARQACAKEDSSNTDGLAIVSNNNDECCDVRGKFDKEDLHHDLYIAEMVAFGYQYWPRHITREKHFQNVVALGWIGALTRCKACWVHGMVTVTR